MITIVDYGIGNLASIKNMLNYLGIKSEIENKIDKIKNASKIILPGVGAFDAAMRRINENDFKEVLNEKALKQQVPILGICLGMQLLTNKSEEGELSGLGWVNAETLSFKNRVDKKYRIPHMGWNTVKITNSSSLTKGFEKLQETKFYFVHSYFVKVNNEMDSIFQTNYGVNFVSSLQKNNIYGVQFHPEKSHKFGMKILDNFGSL